MEENQFNTNITVGLVVASTLGDMEENTREGSCGSMRKEVVIFSQSVVGKQKFKMRFKDVQF